MKADCPKYSKCPVRISGISKEYFNNLPPEGWVRQCKAMMLRQLNKLNMVDAGELSAYVERIVDDMDKCSLRRWKKRRWVTLKKSAERLSSF